MSTQNDATNGNEDDKPKTFYCASIIFFIIGLPMFCMGYFNNLPQYNIANYVKVQGTFTTPYSASFYYQDNLLSCRYLTEFDSSCLSKYTCRKYREFYYPIGSNATLLYLPSSGYCRTTKFTSNLAIAGIIFLGLCILSCAGMCISFRYFPNDKTNYALLKSHKNKYVNKYVKLFGYLEEKCPICDDIYTDENHIAALKNCGHCFHEKCIEMVLNKNNICPMCREIQTV